MSSSLSRSSGLSDGNDRQVTSYAKLKGLAHHLTLNLFCRAIRGHLDNAMNTGLTMLWLEGASNGGDGWFAHLRLPFRVSLTCCLKNLIC